MSVTLNTNVGQVLSGTLLSGHSKKINKDASSITIASPSNKIRRPINIKIKLNFKTWSQLKFELFKINLSI